VSSAVSFSTWGGGWGWGGGGCVWGGGGVLGGWGWGGGGGCRIPTVSAARPPAQQPALRQQPAGRRVPRPRPHPQQRLPGPTCGASSWKRTAASIARTRSSQQAAGRRAGAASGVGPSGLVAAKGPGSHPAARGEPLSHPTHRCRPPTGRVGRQHDGDAVQQVLPQGALLGVEGGNQQRAAAGGGDGGRGGAGAVGTQSEAGSEARGRQAPPPGRHHRRAARPQRAARPAPRAQPSQVSLTGGSWICPPAPPR
jgi:hypothetical protein